MKNLAGTANFSLVLTNVKYLMLDTSTRHIGDGTTKNHGSAGSSNLNYIKPNMKSFPQK